MEINKQKYDIIVQKKQFNQRNTFFQVSSSEHKFWNSIGNFC